MILLTLKNIPQRSGKLFNFCHNVTQTASITGRGTRGGPLCLMPPFPYEKKKFRWYHVPFDKTILRLAEENAKLIVVEGPIGVGKTAFCKALAEQFDMLFMPQPTMDEIYLLPSGYDLRQHDHELPKCIQTFDHKNFCVTPKDNRTGRFQINMLYLKFMKYVDALCHIFNTGQGVILERNYFSDFVFMKAMFDQNYVSRQVYNTYSDIRKNMVTHLIPPHLIIYLDIPVPVVQERIRTRNYSYEQNSPALTKGYLQSLEKYWKQDYLKNASKFSEILVYNWSDGGDVEVIIDDIEKIDFDILRRDGVFKSWRMSRTELSNRRKLYTNKKDILEDLFYFDDHKIPEFEISTSTCLKWAEIMKKIPECRYDIGYNTHMGDSLFSILCRNNNEAHRHPKYHLRFFGPSF